MPAEASPGSAIDAYVERKNPKLKPVTDAARALVRKVVPKSRELLNPWGLPIFEWNGPLCYLMVGKSHVTFGFPRGASLRDPTRLLKGTGKNLRHVKLREVAEVHDANLKQLILQAKKLNREEPLSVAMHPKQKASKR
ncbi:MAG TPA: DUF1801 domain-containing protein [Candidatus Bathyarchaeia archaeon]|nr:DUF1801 domain-containing protein [Candidatus Bathyarchaeia archaeon]